MPDTAAAAASAKHTETPAEEMARLRLEHSDQDAERGIRAWLLAPTFEIYVALMAGEDVPVDRLNEKWVRRYGLRRVA